MNCSNQVAKNERKKEKRKKNCANQVAENGRKKKKRIIATKLLKL